MAYVTGDTILDTHYNGFVSNINDVWGTGVGDFGWGQSGELATVSDGTTVTAAQWSSLVSRVGTVANHTNTTITNDAAPTVGNTIGILANVTSNISTLRTNRTNLHAFGTGIAASSTTSNSTWTTEATQRQQLTFAGGNEARYFFNAGGKITISFSVASGSGDKNSNWRTLATACGTYEIYANSGGKVGGSGTASTNLTGTGYYDLPDSFATRVTLFQQFGTSSYSTNFIRVTAYSSSDHADGLGNNGRIISVQVEYDDAHNTNTDEPVNGDVTTTFTAVPPDTTYITDSWGTPSWSEAVNSAS